MPKLDFKKTMKELYAPSKPGFKFVDVPAMQYLMTDGAGDPNNSPQFVAAVSALYGIAYTTKFMISRKEPEKDYVVPPLEGLWWADDMSNFCALNKDEWKWTLMLMQPDYVTKTIFSEAVEACIKKNKIAESVSVRLEKFKEGKAAQTLFIGAYKDEGPVIAQMHDFIKTNDNKDSKPKSSKIKVKLL